MKFIFGLIIILVNCKTNLAFNYSKEGKKSSSLPKVLLIGDSVSIGYQDIVSNILKEKAIVYHNPGSAGDTKNGIENIEEWLGEEEWDLIYVNFGLEDIKMLDPIENPKGNWGEEGGINTLTMEYEDRLSQLASILNDQQTIVVWSTITPVPANNPDLLLRHWGGGIPIQKGKLRWFPNHVISYNNIAKKIMRQYGIYIHDLYEETMPLLEKIQKSNNPYFTKEGYQYLGAKVSEYIWNLIRPGLSLEVDQHVISILDTDIGPWLDIDDWFDVLIYSISNLKHGGIIMEHYASDWEEAALKRFLKWIDKEKIPFARGGQSSLSLDESGKYVFPHYQDGADLILSTMANTDKKVRLICVGALTNVASAYLRNPELFKSKIEAVWFCGGMLNGYAEAHSKGRWDTNIHRDQIAANIVFNNNIPFVWFPVSLEMIVKSTGNQEEKIKEIDHPAIDWLNDGIEYWHQRRGKEWEVNTQQRPGQGRRLWSIALHAALNQQTEWLEFEKGWARFSKEEWSTFIKDPNGPDLLLVKLNKRKLANWYKDIVTSYFSNKN
jgi:hypothetical protein